LNTQIF